MVRKPPTVCFTLQCDCLMYIRTGCLSHHILTPQTPCCPPVLKLISSYGAICGSARHQTSAWLKWDSIFGECLIQLFRSRRVTQNSLLGTLFSQKDTFQSDIFQDWRILSFSEQSIPVSDHYSAKVFLVFKQFKKTYFILCPSLLVLSLNTTEKNLAPYPLHSPFGV